MKGSWFTGALGLLTGVLFFVLGAVFAAGGRLLTAPLDAMLKSTSEGLHTSANAVQSVTRGVASSSGMIDQVQVSLENTSVTLYRTGEVVQGTISVLEETGMILPAIAGDMAAMPPLLRNLMPGNHFDEVAIRAETVAGRLGELSGRMEALSADLVTTSSNIADVAASVESLREDLLSAEGSFSQAAERMEEMALFLENGSIISTILWAVTWAGILLMAAGIYQVNSALNIRKLMKSAGAE
jgi:hypothetical protein